MKKNLLLLKDLLEHKQKTKIYKYMTAISKSVYIDKLDDIMNEYNNTYHTTIKMKPVMLKIIYISILKKKLMIKILNLKLVIIYKNFKIQKYIC